MKEKKYEGYNILTMGVKIMVSETKRQRDISEKKSNYRNLATQTVKKYHTEI